MFNDNHETASGAPERDYSGQGKPAAILDETADILRSYYGSVIRFLFIERLVVGVFFTGVKLSNGYGGLAYTPPGIIKNASRRILKGNSPTIKGTSADKVISGKMQNPFSDVIRLATMNALSAPFFQDGRYAVYKSDDLSDVSYMFAGRRICMVGAIIPLLRRFKEMGAREIKVIDWKKDSRIEVESARGEFISPEQTAETIAQCETAVFTGATIANGTIDHLLKLVPQKATVAVVGPTAGFIPEPLFRRKVDLVGTGMVTDIDTALSVIAEGGGAYRLFGRCLQKINILNRQRIKQPKQASIPA